MQKRSDVARRNKIEKMRLAGLYKPPKPEVYKYKRRADMPFWYELEQERVNEVLDENSNLSVDYEHDPEAHIELDHFELISRILDYKDLVKRYMTGSRI